MLALGHSGSNLRGALAEGLDLGQWHIAAGTYRIALGRSGRDLVLPEAQLADKVFGR